MAGGAWLAEGVAGGLLAATGWPDKTPEWIGRGSGGGVALVPLAVWWLVVLGWIAVVDWASRDATKLKLQPAFWSGVVGLPLAAAALVAWWIPSVLLGFALMLAAAAGGLLPYVTVRNRSVPATQRVLTLHHARRLVAAVLAKFGVEIDVGEQFDEALPTVTLAAIGGRDAEENAARQAAAEAAAGFEEARKTLLDAVVSRATTVVLEPGQEGFRVRYEVDGVWQPPKVRKAAESRREKERWEEAPVRSKAAGEEAVVALQALTGIESRGEKRAGTFTALVDGKPRACRLEIQPTGGGRMALVKIEAPAVMFKKPADIGMPPPLAERLDGLLKVERGILFLSSPPGSGRTATFDVVLQATDRLLRDFVSIEDAAAPPREIQNIKAFTYDTRTDVTPSQALAKAMLEYPRAIVTRDLDLKNPQHRELLAELVKLAANDTFVIASLPAADAADAIQRIIKDGGIEPKALARVLVGSLAQRLVRKLCPRCREEIPTPPDMLPKLRKTAEELPHVRQASQAGCRLCRGTGHLARTAVFELASGGGLRQAIAADADVKKLREVAVETGMVRLVEAGYGLIAEGVVGEDELKRAFSAQAAPTSSTASAVGGVPTAGARPAAGAKPAGARPATGAAEKPRAANKTPPEAKKPS